LQLWNNVLSANTLGAGSLIPANAVPVVFDFLAASSPWILESESGASQYQPGIAGLKNGGLTVESTLSDGRAWLATPFETVTDTLVLIPSASSTPATRAVFLSAMLLLNRQAHAYSTESSELRPVNICVREVGDAGDRFARIYDMTWAFSGNPFDTTTNGQYATLTLTITRYPYWTPIPLGTNPKWYTFLARGLTPEQFAAPRELARFPQSIGNYNNNVNGTGASFTINNEGFTPSIGYGSTIIRFTSGTSVSGLIRIGNVDDGAAFVQPNTQYTLGVWIRSTGAAFDAVPVRLFVLQTNGGFTTLVTGPNFTVAANADWVYQEITVTTGAGTTQIALGFGKNTSATNAIYDLYGLTVRLTANPLSLTDYNNPNINLRNAIEVNVYNIWTRENPAALRLNYLDVPAEAVPGDAPALVCMVQDRDNITVFGNVNLYISRRLDVLPNEAAYKNTFMAEGSRLTSPTGITSSYQISASRGIASSPGGLASGQYVMQFVLGAGAISAATIAAWRFIDVFSGGKIALFARGAVTSGLIADASFRVDLVAAGTLVTSAIVLSTPSRIMSAPVTFSGLVYMGTLDITQIKNAIRAVEGAGVAGVEYELRFVFAGRTAGAAVTYVLSDLIAMPFDDLMVTITGVTSYNNASTSDQFVTLLDNTGYYNQGDDAVALLHNARTPPFVDSYQARELQGPALTLEPNRVNRLYFTLGASFASPTEDNPTSLITLRTRLNIIPQWRRLRSV
jgi:hypothetical protein